MNLRHFRCLEYQMLHNIKKNRRKTRDGGLSKKEMMLAKGLLKRGYIAQDITFLMTLGRKATINSGRISPKMKDDPNIPDVTDSEIDKYLKIQASYDGSTLLNPFKNARLIKSREAMISAVSIFNNPAILFKTEMFCVLANIAWTYLLHEKLEQTAKGTSKLGNGNSVTLGGTLNKTISPIHDEAVKSNLRKIVEIRDAVEHTYFVDDEGCFYPLFQSCCVNFEKYMTDWFGKHLSLSKELSLALQFVRMGKPQFVELEPYDVPKKIRAIHKDIQDSEFVNNNAFQATVYYGLEANSKTNSEIHRLVKYDDELASDQTTAIKAYKPTKWTETEVVDYLRKNKKYRSFSAHHHQSFWKLKWSNAADRNKNAKEFGEIVLKNQWLWYQEKWVPLVLQFCKDAGDKFK